MTFERTGATKQFGASDQDQMACKRWLAENGWERFGEEYWWGSSWKRPIPD